MARNSAFGAAGGPPPFFSDMNWSNSPDYLIQPPPLPNGSWSHADEISPLPPPDRSDYRLNQQGGISQDAIDRFMGETQRPLFNAPLQIPNQNRGVFSPVGTVPQINHHNRTYSPVPSNGISSSNDSAQSPAGTDRVYYDYSPATQPLDYASPLTDYNHQSQPLPDLSGATNGYSAPQSYLPGVSLIQIQEFEDPQDQDIDYPQSQNVLFAYNDIEDTRLSNPAQYSAFSDSGIGFDEASASPQPTTITPTHIKEETEAGEEDAEGELEDEVEIEIPQQEEGDDLSSDEEYIPLSTRSRKRRPRQGSNPTTKRVRGSPSKPKPRTKSKNTATASTSNRITGPNKRPYTCPFTFAACTSNFSSKNEWKRHTSSQHLNLNVYICHSGTSKTGHPMEFNRKDLFTQHLRRMHAPAPLLKKSNSSAKKGGGSTAGLEIVREQWEEKIKALQERELTQKRAPPMRLACPVMGCGETFEGAEAWDARMEHVGRHLEAGEKVVDERDEWFVQWAEREGVIVKEGAGWKLVGEGRRKGNSGSAGDDVDAEGEEE